MSTRLHPTSIRPPNRVRSRGVALVLTLIAIVVISAVLFTAMSIVTYDARAGIQDQNSDQALYFARYGVSKAQLNWVQARSWRLR